MKKSDKWTIEQRRRFKLRKLQRIGKALAGQHRRMLNKHFGGK
jgi:hypothetical protein